MTLPQVHLAERRRLAEGFQALADVREQERERRESGDRPRQHRLKQGSKQRARERFARNRGIK